MFEGWVADLIASTLGSYLDLTKDRLRISLWEGQSVLRNVRLRPESLEHLQLPITIKEGCVGKLRLQFPWGRWMVHGSPLIIELSDVVLEAHARPEHEWEEGPALARDLAAKQAELAAAELAKLSQRSGWGGGAIVESLTSYLLNSLQLSINNVHLRFSSSPPPNGSSDIGGVGAGVVLGVKFEQLAATRDVHSLPATVYRMLSRAPQSPHVEREIIIKGWQVYVSPAEDSNQNGSSPSTSAGCTSHAQPSNHQPADLQAHSEPSASPDLILHPMHAAMHVSFRHSSSASAGTPNPDPSCQQLPPTLLGVREGVGEGMRLGVFVGAECIQLQISTKQLTALVEVGEAAQVWTKRHRYGRYRPPGWQTQHDKYRAYRQRLHHQQHSGQMQQQESTEPRGGGDRVEGLKAGSSTAAAAPVTTRCAQTILTFSEWQLSQDGNEPTCVEKASIMENEQPGNSSSSSNSSGNGGGGNQKGSRLAISSFDTSSSRSAQPSQGQAYIRARRRGQGEPRRGSRQGRVTWCDVWRYAINSVLHDLRERWRQVGLPPAMSANYQWTLALWQLRYVQLYKCKLERMPGSGGVLPWPKSPTRGGLGSRRGIPQSRSAQALALKDQVRRRSLQDLASQDSCGGQRNGGLKSSGSSGGDLREEPEDALVGHAQKGGIGRSGSDRANSDGGDGAQGRGRQMLGRSGSAGKMEVSCGEGSAREGRGLWKHRRSEGGEVSRGREWRGSKAGLGKHSGAGEALGFWGVSGGAGRRGSEGLGEERGVHEEGGMAGGGLHMPVLEGELVRLEASLDVKDVLRFRSVAEELLQQQHEDQTGRERAAKANSSWVAWGVSGICGFLGHVGGYTRSSAPSAPTDADIRQLHLLLSMDPGSAAEAVAAATAALGSEPKRGSSSSNSAFGLPSVTEQEQQEGSLPGIKTSADPLLSPKSSHGSGEGAGAGVTEVPRRACRPTNSPMHLSAELQVLSVSLTIRDSEQRGVGLVELGEVKAEFGAMGDREEAQLCIKQVQAFDLLSSPGSKQVILCGSNFATSSSDAAAQQLSGWQWWQQGDQDRSEKLEDALEAEGGLSWHAGPLTPKPRPAKGTNPSPFSYSMPLPYTPDITINYAKPARPPPQPLEGDSDLSHQAASEGHGPLYSALLAAVSSNPPPAGSADVPPQPPVDQARGPTRSGQDSRANDSSNVRNKCAPGQQVPPPPQLPLPLPQPTPMEVSVLVQPLHLLYQPHFLQALTGFLGAAHLEGTLDELVQRSICGLPGRHAQLVAKAQHLTCTPPPLQVSVCLKELNVVLEHPPPSTAIPIAGPHSSSSSSVSSSTSQPRLQVRIANLVAETPEEWRYARTSRGVHRALEHLYSAHAGQEGPEAAGRAQSQQVPQGCCDSQAHTTYDEDAALRDLEECLMYSHMDVCVGGVQLQYRAAAQQQPPNAAAGTLQSPPAPSLTALQPLLPPLCLAARLATNRIPLDTCSPATRTSVDVGGWETAAVRASQVADLLSVLEALQQSVLSPSPTVPSSAVPLQPAGQVVPPTSVPAPSASHVTLGLPPLRLTTQLQLRLLPMRVTYTDDVCLAPPPPPGHGPAGGLTGSAFLPSSQQSATAAGLQEHSACTVVVEGIDAGVTLRGPDIEVHATFGQLQLLSGHSSHEAALCSPSALGPWLAVASHLQIGSIEAEFKSHEPPPAPHTSRGPPPHLPAEQTKPLPAEPQPLAPLLQEQLPPQPPPLQQGPLPVSSPVLSPAPGMHGRFQLTGLECRGYPGQPGRFISDAFGGARTGQGETDITASFSSVQGCRAASSAPKGATQQQQQQQQQGGQEDRLTKVSVGLRNLAVGMDLVAALLGAAEATTTAANSTTPLGQGQHPGRKQAADGGRAAVSGGDGGLADTSTSNAKGEVLGVEVSMENLSLLSIVDASSNSSSCSSNGRRGRPHGPALPNPALPNLSTSPGVSTANDSCSSSALPPLHCQALVSLGHLHLSWLPPPLLNGTRDCTAPAYSGKQPCFPSAPTGSDISSSSTQGQHDEQLPACDPLLLLLQGLTVCVANEVGSHELSPVLLIPHIQATPMPSRPLKMSVNAVGQEEPHIWRGHPDEVVSVTVDVPAIHIALARPSQAQVVGCIAARLQQCAAQRRACQESEQQQRQGQGQSYASGNSNFEAARAEADSALVLPPPPPMRAQLRLGLLEAVAPACPATASSQAMRLAWQEVAVHYRCQGGGDEFGDASGEKHKVPSLTASLQWQQLSFSLTGRTPQPAASNAAGVKPQLRSSASALAPAEGGTRPPASSCVQVPSPLSAMAVLHGPSLSVVAALSHQQQQLQQQLGKLQGDSLTQQTIPQPLPSAAFPTDTSAQGARSAAQPIPAHSPPPPPPPSSTFLTIQRRRTRRRAGSAAEAATATASSPSFGSQASFVTGSSAQGWKDAAPSRASSFFHSCRSTSSFMTPASSGFPQSTASSQQTSPIGTPTGRSEDEFFSASASPTYSEVGSDMEFDAQPVLYPPTPANTSAQGHFSTWEGRQGSRRAHGTGGVGQGGDEGGKGLGKSRGQVGRGIAAADPAAGAGGQSTTMSALPPDTISLATALDMHQSLLRGWAADKGGLTPEVLLLLVGRVMDATLSSKRGSSSSSSSSSDGDDDDDSSRKDSKGSGCKLQVSVAWIPPAAADAPAPMARLSSHTRAPPCTNTAAAPAVELQVQGLQVLAASSHWDVVENGVGTCVASFQQGAGSCESVHTAPVFRADVGTGGPKGDCKPPAPSRQPQRGTQQQQQQQQQQLHDSPGIEDKHGDPVLEALSPPLLLPSRPVLLPPPPPLPIAAAVAKLCDTWLCLYTPSAGWDSQAGGSHSSSNSPSSTSAEQEAPSTSTSEQPVWSSCHACLPPLLMSSPAARADSAQQSGSRLQPWCSAAPCMAVCLAASISLKRGAPSKASQPHQLQPNATSRDLLPSHCPSANLIGSTPTAAGQRHQGSNHVDNSEHDFTIFVEVPGIDALVGTLSLQQAGPAPDLHHCPNPHISGAPQFPTVTSRPSFTQPLWTATTHCMLLAHMRRLEASCSIAYPPQSRKCPPLRRVSEEELSVALPSSPPSSPPHTPTSEHPQTFSSPVRAPRFSPAPSAYLSPASPPSAPSQLSSAHSSPPQRFFSFQRTNTSLPWPPSDATAAPPASTLASISRSSSSGSSDSSSSVSSVMAPVGMEQVDNGPLECRLAARVAASEVSLFAIQHVLASAARMAAAIEAAQSDASERAALREHTACSYGQGVPETIARTDDGRTYDGVEASGEQSKGRSSCMTECRGYGRGRDGGEQGSRQQLRNDAPPLAGKAAAAQHVLCQGLSVEVQVDTVSLLISQDRGAEQHSAGVHGTRSTGSAAGAHAARAANDQHGLPLVRASVRPFHLSCDYALIRPLRVAQTGSSPMLTSPAADMPASAGRDGAHHRASSKAAAVAGALAAAAADSSGDWIRGKQRGASKEHSGFHSLQEQQQQQQQQQGEQDWRGSHSCSMVLSLGLEAEVFNSSKRGWEPALDAWAAQAAFTEHALLTANSSGAMFHDPLTRHKGLRILCPHTLEVTASPSLLLALVRVDGMVSALQAEHASQLALQRRTHQRRPSIASAQAGRSTRSATMPPEDGHWPSAGEGQMQGEGGVEPQASCFLVNELGTDLRFCLVPRQPCAKSLPVPCILTPGPLEQLLPVSFAPQVPMPILQHLGPQAPPAPLPITPMCSKPLSPLPSAHSSGTPPAASVAVTPASGVQQQPTVTATPPQRAPAMVVPRSSSSPGFQTPMLPPGLLTPATPSSCTPSTAGSTLESTAEETEAEAGPQAAVDAITPCPAYDLDLLFEVQGFGVAAPMCGRLPIHTSTMQSLQSPPVLLLPLHSQEAMPHERGCANSISSCVAGAFGMMCDVVPKAGQEGGGKPHSMVRLHTNVRVTNCTDLVLRLGCAGEGGAATGSSPQAQGFDVDALTGDMQQQQQQQRQRQQQTACSSQPQQHLTLPPRSRAWLPAPLLQQNSRPGILALQASTTSSSSAASLCTKPPTEHPVSKPLAAPGEPQAGQQQQQQQQQQEAPFASMPGSELDLGWMVLELERQLERQREQEQGDLATAQLQQQQQQQRQVGMQRSLSSPSHSPSEPSVPHPSDIPPKQPSASQGVALAPGVLEKQDAGGPAREHVGEAWASRKVQVKCAGWCSRTGATLGRDYAAVVAGAPGTVHLLLVLSKQAGSQVWELRILPHLMLRNQLPVPVRVSAMQGLHGCMALEGGAQELGPCSSTAMLGLDPSSMQALLVKPHGFGWSAPCDINLTRSHSPPPISTSTPTGSAAAVPPPACAAHSSPAATVLASHTVPLTIQAPSSPRVVMRLILQSLSPSLGAALPAQLPHPFPPPLPNQSAAALGTHTQRYPSWPPQCGRERTQQLSLSLLSPLWVYNCTGMPVALRQAPLEVLQEMQEQHMQDVQHQQALPSGGSFVRSARRDAHTSGLAGSMSSATGLPGRGSVDLEAAPATAAAAGLLHTHPPELWLPPSCGPDGWLGQRHAAPHPGTVLQAAQPAQYAPGLQPQVNAQQVAAMLPQATYDGAVAAAAVALGSPGLTEPPSLLQQSQQQQQQQQQQQPVRVGNGVHQRQASLLARGLAQQQQQQQQQIMHDIQCLPHQGFEKQQQQQQQQEQAGGVGGGLVGPALLPTLCGDLPVWDGPLQLCMAPHAGLGYLHSSKLHALPVWSAPATLQLPPPPQPINTAGQGSSQPQPPPPQQQSLPPVQLITCVTPSRPPLSTPASPKAHSPASHQEQAPGMLCSGSGLHAPATPEQLCPGYVLAARLSPVLSSPGSWALHLLPRHLVCNAAGVPLRLRQEGCGLIRTGLGVHEQWMPLAPSQRRPLHWPAVHAPLQFSVSVCSSSYDWDWSCSLGVASGDEGMEGGPSVAHQADGKGWGRLLSETLVKVRRRQPDTTASNPHSTNSKPALLLRVEQLLHSSGTLLILISEKPAGQAPYRIENDTAETLLVHQEGCSAQDAVLPFSRMPFAWDEPLAQPLRLMVQLQGGQQWLGVWRLDELQPAKTHSVGRWLSRQPKKRFNVEIRPDKTVRVLRISTPVPQPSQPPALLRHSSLPHSTLTQAHSLRPYTKAAAAAATAAAAASAQFVRTGSMHLSRNLSLLRPGQSHPRQPVAAAAAAAGSPPGSTHGSAGAGPLMHQEQQQQGGQGLAGCEGTHGCGAVFDMEVQFAGVGVSVVGEAQELAYLAVGELQGGLHVTMDKVALHLSLSSLRCDNCLRDAAHPVAFAAPVSRSWWGPPVLPPSTCCVPNRSPCLPLDPSIPHPHLHPSTQLTSSGAAAAARTAGPGLRCSSASGWGRGSGLGALARASAVPPAVSVQAVVCLRVPEGVLCCEQLRVTAAAMAANVDERQGRALLAHASHMGEAVAQERAAMLTQHVLAQQQSKQQQQQHLSLLQGAAIAGSSLGAGEPNTARPERSQKGSLGAGDRVHAVGGKTAGVAQAEPPLACPALPAPFPTCLQGSLGGQPDVDLLTGPAPQPGTFSPCKVYISDISISRARLALSFTPASWRCSSSSSGSSAWAAPEQRGQPQLFSPEASPLPATTAMSTSIAGTVHEQGLLVRLLLSLARLERAWITLKPLHIGHPLLGVEQLTQVLERHYRSGLLQLPLLVGSLDIFGDVTSLVQAWATGMWHLLAMPARGALRGGLPYALAGLASGLQDLSLRTTQASLNSSRKFSARARAVLATLCSYEVALAVTRGSHAHRIVSSSMEGGIVWGPLQALGAGYRAWLSDLRLQISALSPIGIASQLPAMLLLPCIVGLEIVEGTLAKLRNSLVPPSQAIRIRVPRYVDPQQPLQRYSWLHSYCRLLHQHVAGGAFAHEPFQACGAVARGGGFVFITHAHIVVAVPQLANETSEAQAALVIPVSALLWASHSGCCLQLVHTSTTALSYQQQQKIQASRMHPLAVPAATAAAGARASLITYPQEQQQQQQQQQQDSQGLPAASLPAFTPGSRSAVLGSRWGGEVWHALTRDAAVLRDQQGLSAQGAGIGDQQGLGMGGWSRGRSILDNNTRGRELRQWLPSYPMFLGHPYGGAVRAAGMLAGMVEAAAAAVGGDRIMDDRGKTRSSNVPGWLGVSRIELDDEEEALRLQVLIQELLATNKPRTHALFIS